MVEFSLDRVLRHVAGHFQNTSGSAKTRTTIASAVAATTKGFSWEVPSGGVWSDPRVRRNIEAVLVIIGICVVCALLFIFWRVCFYDRRT